MPAPSGGRKVRVANLRDQAVEIHHGGAVVVIAPYGATELPLVATGGEQLAELARQELVSVETLRSPQRAARTARRTEPRPARPRSSGSTTKRKPPKRGS